MLAIRATPPLFAAVLLFAANPAIRPHASEPPQPPVEPATRHCPQHLDSIDPLPPFPPAIAYGVSRPPADFADMQRWPHGMVMHPPDTHDRMVAGPDLFAALLAPLVRLL